MHPKKLRVLVAEGGAGETAEVVRKLFHDAATGLELTVVATMATLIPTIKVVDSEIILLDLEFCRRIMSRSGRWRDNPWPTSAIAFAPDAGAADQRLFARIAGRSRGWLELPLPAKTVQPDDAGADCARDSG